MIESPQHDLDTVIDRVAARMVEVPEDASLVARTVARLPERAVTPWFLALPVQVTVGAALVLAAFLHARPSREVPPRADLPVVERAAVTPDPRSPIPDPRSPIPDPRSPIPDPRSPIPDPRSPIPDPRSLIPAPRSPIPDRPDHERSLPPVDRIDAIELTAIAEPALELDSPLQIEPLELSELPLAPQGDW